MLFVYKVLQSLVGLHYHNQRRCHLEMNGEDKISKKKKRNETVKDCKTVSKHADPHLRVWGKQ